ncbi:MAG: acetate kinase [Pseudobacteriovorax sp.]|nr:acetate kinase [Pseudobacteriovorax sp.]
MNVLVLNCGSSSLKFQVISVDQESIEQNNESVLAKGLIERIGSQSLLSLTAKDQKTQKSASPFRNHKEAIDFILKWLISPKAKIPKLSSLSDIDAVGHRVVHGGEKFSKSVMINERVITGIEDCIDLAPLHNPANLSGIEAISEILGAIPQAAVFDTAFHSNMPEESYLYPIPYQFYRRHKIRRYGFHGTSHRYISYRYRQLGAKEKKDTNIITLHLGNGCSACAIVGGQSIETSMGMTPLEGLAMGTRAGDIDPTIIEFLNLKEGMSYENIFSMLNKQSGLLGISGLTNDMRELIEEEEENADRRAKLAINIFCERIKKYIGAYLAISNGADAIIFSGGIGENSPYIRKKITAGLDFFGISVDDQKNQEKVRGVEGDISSANSSIKTLVIPTNEELLIARDTYRCIEGIM